VLLSAALGAPVYAGFAMYADVRAVRAALETFHWGAFAAAVGLAATNWLLRMAKWEYYLRALGVRLPLATSARVYFAGFSLSVTPGKMGEVVKSLLLKREAGVPVSRTAPIVLAERFTDLVGYLVLMALAGIGTFPRGRPVFAAALVLLLAVLGLASSPRFAAFAVRILAGVGPLRRFAPKAEAAFASSRLLLAPRRLVFPTAISIVSWFCECLGFFVVARTFGPSTSLGLATFTYAFSAIAGAVSMVPGGLLVTESSLGYFLDHYAGFEKGEAAAATLLIRLATLWSAVAVGSFALAISLRRRRNS
jgi:uncharacterized membrane protein YbhN (UPF0104 family)